VQGHHPDRTILARSAQDPKVWCAGGHIRAIAKVVGVDPEPLIQEFDSTHRGAETS
jgi:cytoskeletal protein RodZ